MLTKSIRAWLGGKSVIPPTIYLSQYDTNYQFVFTVYDGDSVWTIPEGASVIMEGVKKDGTIFIADGSIDNSNHAVVDCGPQLTAVGGAVVCELRFAVDGEIVGTANFTLNVEAAPASGHIMSEDDFSAIDQLVNKALVAAQQTGDAAAAVSEIRASISSPFVIAKTASEMTDTEKAYVYVGAETGYTFGGWYYHNGTSWTYGGVATDTTLAVSGIAADAKATGDAIDAVDNDCASHYQSLNDFNGVSLSDAGATFKLMQRALNSDAVSFYDLIRFTPGKGIFSDGTIGTQSGKSATEDYLTFPADVIVTTGAGITVQYFTYNSSHEKTGSASILQNKTVTIPSGYAYIRFSINTEAYATAPVTMTMNVDGMVFADVDELTTKITKGMALAAVGNLITNLEAGVINKNGSKSTGNYVFTNKIPVIPGQTLSFWSEVSNVMTNAQARIITAYDSSGTAVEAKGADYMTVYTVPDGIYAVIVTFANSLTNLMAIYGIKKPIQYSTINTPLFIADDVFANTVATRFAQGLRNNNELHSGVKYYLDKKSAICYCAPDNLATAKINLYFNEGSGDGGSAACFVNFASGTFGFYESFGSYNAASLVVHSSESIELVLDATHEYCIEYDRNAVSPAYTLKITDMMTLESDSITDERVGAGWGSINYDATDVTVNKFKRLTKEPIQPTILFLGDSYTEGGTVWTDRDKRWCYLLGEAVESYAISGQGGARSNDIEAWIDNYLFDVFAPKYVVIETGTNELDIAYFRRNLTSIIAKVKSVGAVPILCTVPVTITKPNPSNYNSFVINSGLPYIDICRALTIDGDMTTQNLNLFLTDKIHPNFDGHNAIFEMAKLNIPEVFRRLY